MMPERRAGEGERGGEQQEIVVGWHGRVVCCEKESGEMPSITTASK